MNPPRNPDPLGYLDELRHALRRFEAIAGLRVAGTEATAFRVIVNLGYCRLYGIDVPSDVAAHLNAVLTRDVVIAAATELVRVLGIWHDDAVSLPERFDEAEPLENRLICADVVDELMESWAAFVAIDERYQFHLEHGTGSNGLDGAIDRVLAALASRDDVLQEEERLRLLSVATELRLLENSRQMLAAPFRESLPWWLDGTLEAVAEQTTRQIAADELILFGRTRATIACDKAPPAAVLLFRRRNQEIAEWAKGTRIAASVAVAKNGEADDLRHSQWAVVGEPSISVRFAIEPATCERRDFGVFLIGASDDLRRFVSIDIQLFGGACHEASLQLGEGHIEVEGPELECAPRVTLIDREGNRSPVDLGESCRWEPQSGEVV